MKNYIGYKAAGMFPEAHLTLIYTGDLTEEQEARVEEILLTVDPSLHRFLGVRQQIKMFGPHQSIPVVTVMVPDEIVRLRSTLIELGVPNPSTFDWNPHVTLDLSVSSTINIPFGMTFYELGLY